MSRPCPSKHAKEGLELGKFDKTKASLCPSAPRPHVYSTTPTPEGVTDLKPSKTSESPVELAVTGIFSKLPPVRMAPPQQKTSVLFVCTGNICRSPMAEAVFRSLSKSNSRVGEIDSAGTHAAIYHNLDPPDPRTMDTLRKNGITAYDHASRGVVMEDFDNFDYVFAMDDWNLSELQKKQTKRPNSKAQVMLFGTYGGKSRPETVVDPYYGADNGFDEVYEQVVRFSKNFLKKEIDKKEEKGVGNR